MNIKPGQKLVAVLLSVSFGITALHAQHYKYTNMDPNAGSYIPKGYTHDKRIKDLQNVQMLYYVNNSLKEIISLIEKNKKWRNQFENMKNDTMFNFNKYLDMYSALLGMENDIITDVLKSKGFKPQMRPKKPLLYKVDSIKEEIKSTLRKSPKNYKNFMHLINTFKKVIDIKSNIEKSCGSAYSVLMHKVLYGKYKSENPKIGNLSKFSLILVDNAMANKLFQWKINLSNRLLQTPDKYVKYFGSFIKNPKAVEKNY